MELSVVEPLVQKKETVSLPKKTFTCDGVTREQVAELAAAYDSEIVGEISVTGDYQLRLSAVPVELEAIVESISAEPLVESATLNYVSAVSGEADIGSFCFGREWDGEFKRYPPAFYKAWGFNKINTAVAWNELDAHASEIAPVKVGVCDVGFAPQSSRPRICSVFL